MFSRFIRLLSQDQPTEIDEALAAVMTGVALIGMVAVTMLA